MIISTPQNSLKLYIEFHLKLHTDYSNNFRNVFSSKQVHKFRWVILVPTTLRRSSDPTNSGCQNDEIYKINCPGSFFICVEIRPSFVYVKLICCVCVRACTGTWILVHQFLLIFTIVLQMNVGRDRILDILVHYVFIFMLSCSFAKNFYLILIGWLALTCSVLSTGVFCLKSFGLYYIPGMYAFKKNK